MSNQSQKPSSLKKPKIQRELSATTLKHHGAGDGNKTPSLHPEKTIMTPSSRKFSARLSKDHTSQLKLKKILEDIDTIKKSANSPKIRLTQKSKSVAEITPTKNKIKIPRLHVGSSSAITLLATPRPLYTDIHDVEDQKSTARILSLSQMTYQRFLLFVWRRSKIRCAKMSDSLKIRQDQIFQLEQQVSCLKGLVQSECMKRTEVSNECLKLKNLLEILESQSAQLALEKTGRETEIQALKNTINELEIDLENARNVINSKSLYLNNLAEELKSEKAAVKNLDGEKDSYLKKIKMQQHILEEQENTIQKLESTLKIANEQLKTSSSLKKAHMEDFNELQEQFRRESARNNSLNMELNNLLIKNEGLEKTAQDFETKLLKLQEELKEIQSENSGLKNELLKINSDSKCWWKNAREFLVVSWTVLQHAAYVMLPAA